MATMSMNAVIHGAVRRDLQRFRDALGNFHAADPARARALGLAWDNFDTQLTHHHESEHAIAWPAMTTLGVSPDLISRLDAEHDAMATALARAREAFTVFRDSGSTADAATTLAAIEGLREATLTHLDHEESQLEPVMRAHQGSPVLKQMGRQFGRQMSLAQSGTFFAWLSHGASTDELAALTGEIPKPVVLIIGGLFGRDYRRTVVPTWGG